MTKSRAIARRSLIPLLLCLAGAAGRAAPFSAELLFTRDTQALTGRFQYQGPNYRFDFVEDGRQLVVLFDGPSGVTRLLSPAEKAYYEGRQGEPIAMFANPFGAYAFLSKTKTVRTEGTGTVGGVACKKVVVLSGDQVWLNAWVADGYDVPLKVEIPIYKIAVELKNPIAGPQDPTQFVVPAGYTLKSSEREAESQPDWVGQVAGAPVLTPPCEKALAEGGIIRIRTQAGRWISIEGTNTGKAQGSFTALPFKDGKSLGASEMGTTILDAGDSGAMNVGSQPPNADELAVRVGQGTMKLKVTYVAPTGAVAESAAAAEPPTPEAAAPEVGRPGAVDLAARFEVSWQGPGNREDFIAVAQPGQPAGASVSRTSVREGNPLKIWAPSEPGRYEIRYVLGREARVLAKAPLTVNAVPAKVEAPGAADVAARIEVHWQGPAAEGDFISLALPSQPAGAAAARAAVREGNPAKLWLPGDAGVYEVRYVLGRGTKVLARAPLTVNAVTATVGAPGAADVAARIEVRWQGPAAEGDFISLVRPNQPAGAAVVRALVRDGNPARLWLPADAGQYEIRYVLARGAKLLAKAPIALNPVTATVNPPAVAKAGTEFEVRWQGPGYPEDFIAVARVGQPVHASLSAAKVKPGGMLKLRAPREPGTYEVRYVLGRGPRLLAKTTVTVEAP